MKKILVVDDLEATVEEEKRILSNRDLTIFTATSGEEALAIHKREKVDLIITDLDMPGMNGDKLCSLIRKDASLKAAPVIIVGYNRKSDLDRSTNCGASSYISKPVDPAQFIEKVSRLIDVPKRSGVRVLIKVSVQGSVARDAFFCTSVNISTSGILLEADRILSNGDVITCSFFIPGSDRIVVDCEVRRNVRIAPDAFHYGVKFLNLPPEQKAAIEAFVRSKTG